MTQYRSEPDELRDTRTQLLLRVCVNAWIGRGYEVVSRDPLRLERGRQWCELRNGVLIHG